MLIIGILIYLAGYVFWIGFLSTKGLNRIGICLASFIWPIFVLYGLGQVIADKLAGK